jgi:hypothetical protein
MSAKKPDLAVRTLHGGRVNSMDDDSWRMSIPGGPAGEYRLAQLDDYTHLPRDQFPWTPPLTLHLRARASHKNIPGTWGFGVWNDPFITDLGFAGGTRRLPVLPDTAWFFFASPENYLSLDDTLPASGELAATFHSRKIPSLLLALAIPIAPLFFIGSIARFLRKTGTRIIHQDAAEIQHVSGPHSRGATEWREYSIKLASDEAVFVVDGVVTLKTKVAPSGPLGLVIWIDNQFAAVPPQGGVQWGTLVNPEESWIEIAGISIQSG